MHVNDLKIFQAVAEHNSFTKAAIANNTVQSNVTARVKFLEEYFNARLFERTSRKIELTPAGEQLLKVARELQLMLENAKASISGVANPVKGLIKIGCIHTTAALRAPGILQDFTSSYPEMEFHLKTGTTSSLVKDVLSYKLDGAFVAGITAHPQLNVQPVVTEELCIVTSSMTDSVDQLKSSSKRLKLVVFGNGCSYRKHFEMLLNDWENKRFTTIEVDTLEGIVNTVEAGIGVTLLPLALIEKYYSYRNLRTFRLPETFAKMQTVFIKRTDIPMSEGYNLFFKMIEKGYGDTIA